MASAWYVQQRSGNSGWVDVTWSLGVGGGCGHRRDLAAWTGLAALAADDGGSSRRILVLAARRCTLPGAPDSSDDDPRYRNLIIQWGSDAPRRMFWFLQSQAAVGIVLALSIVLAAHNPNPNLRIQDLIGLAILLAAIVGEAVADRQLRAFKSDPAQSKGHLRCRSLAMVPPSELFLRMAVVARLSDYCHRFRRPKPLRMARASRASLHVLGAGTRIRHSAARRAYAALSRRSVSRLSKANARLFPIAVEMMLASASDLPIGQPRTSVLKQRPGRSGETKWIT